MKNILLSLMLLFPASTTLAQDQPAPDAPEETPEKTPEQEPIEDKIKRLIADLGEDSYELREKAQAALEKIGKPAVEALRKAIKSIDLEVSSRARELLEKITGNKIEPEADPDAEQDTPSVPPGEALPFDPTDMKDILDKLEEFEKLSPNLKKTLDSFRKLLEGDEDDEKGTLGNLFDQLFGEKTPEPEVDTTPLTTPAEKALGISVWPVGDTLRSHLAVTPGWANNKTGYWVNPKQLTHGLVITRVDPKGVAFSHGFRKHDILIFTRQSAPPETPWVTAYWPDWLKWRKAGKALAKPEDLDALTIDKTMFVEVIRKGKTCTIVNIKPANPVPSKPVKKF